MKDLELTQFPALFVIIVLGLLVAAGLVFVSSFAPRTASVILSQNVPPPTTEQLERLAQSKGFQYVVSHTNGGFQPANIIVHVGETVRFTNSASEGMWIIRADARTSAPQDCDMVFDSCSVLQNNGDFWEYTARVLETITYIDKLHPEHRGVITVIK